MEPPVPKPRSALPQSSLDEPQWRPVPMPRSRAPAVAADRVSATGIMRSIGTVSKQISEDVAAKVTHSAKTANEKIEKSILEGSRFAKDTLEKTLTTSRAVRDSVTKSVMEGSRSAGLRMRLTRRSDNNDESDQRCVSMPTEDFTFFDNIQFHSPLLEQKKYKNDGDSQSNQDMSSLNLNASNLDDRSIVSSNSDSNIDTISNFSYVSRESEQNITMSISDSDQLTYDAPKSSQINSVVSTNINPKAPERRKKRQIQSEVIKLNSMYENWTLPSHTRLDKHTEIDRSDHPSKSTIYEFDPLNSTGSSDRYMGLSNELLLLESFLIGDNYGTIVAHDTNEDNFDDYGETDYFNPPTPPERSDSLLTSEVETKSLFSSADKDRNSNWYIGGTDTDVTETDTINNSKTTNSVKQKISDMLKLDNVLHKTYKHSGSQHKIEQVERPPINQLPVPYLSGMLTKTVSGGVEDLFKNCQSRYCVLSDQKLMCYTDPTNSVLKEAYSLENINSVQVVLPLSSSGANGSYSVELSVGVCGGGARRVVLSWGSAAERRAWAQKLAEQLTAAFPAKYTAEYTRCGWCYLKEGVTGAWRGAWLLLARRQLLCAPAGHEAPALLDLRKTRCIVTQEADEGARRAGGAGATLLLDCPHATVYLRLPHERDLKGWRGMLRLAATNNGAQLHHQQLTRHDVPVLVDKCIAFVYAHGSLSEGIYRRAGGAAALGALAAALRRDAWAVTLAPAAHSEHDVAGVLKRFFRDLPDPLLPPRLHRRLLAATEIAEEGARHAELRRLLASLPRVARCTARALFAHLHFVAELAHINRMPAHNLAAVWAPTLLSAPAAPTTSSDGGLVGVAGAAGVSADAAWCGAAARVVRVLIAEWAGVWRASGEERAREAAVRSVLARVHAARAPPPPRAAGALRLWVHVRDTEHSVNVELVPGRTSGEVAEEVWLRAGAECGGGGGGGGARPALHEVVLGGALRRVLPRAEPVLPAVLRWAYWDDIDRKDNYLVVCEEAAEAGAAGEAGEAAHALSGPLLYAPPASRSFRTFLFRLGGGKLCYFKDKQGREKAEEWSVAEQLWYSGHEPRRPPPPSPPPPAARWALTFVPANNKPNRTRARPWFGGTLAGAGDGADGARWLAALAAAAAPPASASAPAAAPAAPSTPPHALLDD